MRMDRKWLGLVAALCALGCTQPPIDVLVWEPLEMDSFAVLFERPSGSLNVLNAEDLAAQVQGVDLPLAQSVIALGMTVIDSTSSETGRREGALELGVVEQVPLDKLPGTRAYLRLACPGPDPAVQDTTFNFGELRVDTPELTEEFLTRGDLFLTFKDCVLPAGTLNGGSRAFFAADPTAFAVELRVSITPPGETDSTLVSRNIMLTGDDLVWVVFADEEGQTYVAATDPGEGASTFRVKAKNGVLTCELNADGGACDNPSGEDFSWMGGGQQP